MRSVLVLFDSESDEYIYNDILEYLEPNFNVSFETLSVHSDLDKVVNRLKKNDFDFALVGAGHGIALPSICATCTDRPVFGVPVPNFFGGLDAFLSIVQTPLEVPVGAVSPKSMASFTSFLGEVASKNSRVINIVLSQDVESHEYAIQEYSRLEEYALHLGLEVKKSNSIDESLMNIVLVHSDHNLEVANNALYVPLLTNSEKNSPAHSIRILNTIDHGGIWFGINNPRNALKFLSKFL